MTSGQEISGEIVKRHFEPYRYMAANRLRKLPKTWICNIHKEHSPGGILVDSDSPEKKTKILECFCVQCVEFDEQIYKFGRPVVTGDYSLEKLEAEFVGVWFTRYGWIQHNRPKSR